MSVVLPDPLGPTRPKTLPRGTAKFTRSSARLAPKRRVSPTISITFSTEPVLTFSLLCGVGTHCAIPLPDQVQDFLDADVHLPGLGQQGVDPPGQNVEAFAPGQRGSGVGNVRARARRVTTTPAASSSR